MSDRPKCSYDPSLIPNSVPIGMFHCPECGEMVIAGMPHPDYSLLDDLSEDEWDGDLPEEDDEI